MPGRFKLRAPLSVLLLVGCQSESPSQRSQHRDADTPDAATCNAADGLRLYDERIDPLFRDDRPSTCNQCHLSGIDLKQYIRATPCETYACLVQQRLVDEQRPERSKILAWIERAEPESELITKDVIDAEYSAFFEWISFNAQCEQCSAVDCPIPSDAGTFCADESHDPHDVTDSGTMDAGTCGQADIEALFRSRVYSLRGRCSPCHVNLAENEQYEAPLWIELAPDCETASKTTLSNVIGGGYVNFDDPERSLLLQKPLPESRGGVAHGGGDKFDNTDDPGYRSFLEFIERLVDCQTSSTADQ